MPGIDSDGPVTFTGPLSQIWGWPVVRDVRICFKLTSWSKSLKGSFIGLSEANKQKYDLFFIMSITKVIDLHCYWRLCYHGKIMYVSTFSFLNRQMV